MNLAKYRCLACGASQWHTSTTVWTCAECGYAYRCAKGMPKLYLEDQLGSQDRSLRDRFYDGFFGLYYKHTMPFLVLPVRPASISWQYWLVYALAWALLLAAVLYVIWAVFSNGGAATSPGVNALLIAAFIAAAVFFANKRYLLYLLALALPLKVLLQFRKYKPRKSFVEVHAEVISELSNRNTRLQILDVSTGACASLYKHGWMKLNAEYTGVDLSETMLSQGADFMAAKAIPVDLALANAMHLPLSSETFDVVLNYGAVNSYSNPPLAVDEMLRVTKKGGVVLFLDEQLYQGASKLERLYFNKVLAAHDVISHCPVDHLPADIGEVTVHQIYEFYYLCVIKKAL